MGIFSFNNPVSKAEREKEKITKGINKFYNQCLAKKKYTFYRPEIVDYLHLPVDKETQMMIDQNLEQDATNNRIYARFQEYCPNPNCNRDFLEGAAIPTQGGWVFLVGQVPLQELNLICPYCGTKLPKQNQLKIASQSVIYQLTPSFIHWYQQQMQQPY